MDSPVEQDGLEDHTYEPPEPIYEPSETRPKPRQEQRSKLRRNTNIFTDSVNSNDSPNGRGGSVQYLVPFNRARGVLGGLFRESHRCRYVKMNIKIEKFK